jgi:hypothetical protein
MRSLLEFETLIEPVVEGAGVEIEVGSLVGVGIAGKVVETVCEEAQPARINPSPTKMPQKRGNL